MSEPLENLYFNWLCAKIIRLENPTPSLKYDELLRTLHSTEFVWIVPGDNNRAEDGVELRREFLIEAGYSVNESWQHYPCSVLEMLIAFSRRANFATDIPSRTWFWEFIENLGLIEFNDASGAGPEEVWEMINPFLWRTYSTGGKDGGLFPLEQPTRDQRTLEIWYQFCDYLVDQDRMP